MPIRLLLAEDNVLLRDGLARLFAQSDDIDLIGSCGTYDQLVALVDADPPDVVLTDIRMPPTFTDEGIRAARWPISTCSPFRAAAPSRA